MFIQRKVSSNRDRRPQAWIKLISFDSFDIKHVVKKILRQSVWNLCDRDMLYCSQLLPTALMNRVDSIN